MPLPVTQRKLTAGPRRAIETTERLRDRIPPDLLHRRRALRRGLLDIRRTKNAIEHIKQLPCPGESLHFIVDGRFEPCNLIPATRKLSHPATFRRVDITTLGLNLDNTQTLINGLDQGKIGECTVLVSCFFARAKRHEYAHLKREIEGRGGRVHGMRTHSKLILMETTDGNWYTIEGSGNLRACGSIEQFVMTNDRDLLLFHRGWLDDYIRSRADWNDTQLREGQ